MIGAAAHTRTTGKIEVSAALSTITVSDSAPTAQDTITISIDLRDTYGRVIDNPTLLPTIVASSGSVSNILYYGNGTWAFNHTRTSEGSSTIDISYDGVLLGTEVIEYARLITGPYYIGRTKGTGYAPFLTTQRKTINFANIGAQVGDLVVLAVFITGANYDWEMTPIENRWTKLSLSGNSFDDRTFQPAAISRVFYKTLTSTTDYFDWGSDGTTVDREMMYVAYVIRAHTANPAIINWTKSGSHWGAVNGANHSNGSYPELVNVPAKANDYILLPSVYSQTGGIIPTNFNDADSNYSVQYENIHKGTIMTGFKLVSGGGPINNYSFGQPDRAGNIDDGIFTVITRLIQVW